MITVNGRAYRLPSRPVVGICLDGTSSAYLEAAADLMPNLQSMREAGAAGTARAVIPSFTNPNNVAIATGVPPAENGICGNYYFDEARGQEVMMNDPAYLRCPTIFGAFAAAGESVAVVTTKDKLRLMLGKDLRGMCVSVETGGAELRDLVGRPAPGIYDPEISIYCLETGVRLLETRRVALMYLSTTDFVQHKFPPASEQARSFYARADEMLGRLHHLNAVVGITADHGMNDKTNPDGTPNIRFLETLLEEAGFRGARVILPITDPYVVHHGALGSWATVYFPDGLAQAARKYLETIPGVELVLTRDEAARRFSLPADRLGELVVLGDQSTVLGRTPSWHDLSAVGSGLRSHGGLHEGSVPLIINRRLRPEWSRRLAEGNVNNYDLFDFALNGVVE